ncbi:MAG: hypothetical protein LUB59_04000, partial [Candidatus Gastranaerophilales bacterium]|nr:hypothetical protein [Candidatus Gastranaerophilales bacterium]
MADFKDFYIENNGKKEQLKDIKHGVRKEQVSEKFHDLFNAYDTNQDGTLEASELEVLSKGLSTFAGADKTLDVNENKQITSLFANQIKIENADFMGFVKSVSDASAEIVSSTTTPTSDGGKEITTTYNDGTVETIAYYADGEYKLKKTDQKTETTTTYYTKGQDLNKEYTANQIESEVKQAYNKRVAEIKKQNEQYKDSTRISIIPDYQEFKKSYLKSHNINQNTSTNNFERHDLELSERAKADVEVRDFLLTHFVETHKSTQEALNTMGVLDDIGAAINAGAGELYNACKNIYNKHFGDGSEEDYQNFYELVKKFEPNSDNAVRLGGRAEFMQQHPEEYFRSFETEFKSNTGNAYDIKTGYEFKQKTEQYQNAQILNQRIQLLKEAMKEVTMYQAEQDALVYSPAQSEGLNPANHILNANKLLLQYFDNDQEAVGMALDGAIGNNQKSIAAIQALLDKTEKLNKSVLGDKTFDEIKEEYNNQYKEIYGVDFVPDELNDKIMNAKATGGMVKLAAITAISVLVTKSPAFASLSGTGAAAGAMRTLITKYGQAAVQQGIKFAMTSGTLAADAGLILLNQATSERGVDGEELWESTKGSAKYIYFGSYIGAPLAQAVSRQLGKIGAATRLFEGGTKSTAGAMQTTSITGDKLVQNFMKGGNKVLTTGGAFLTDVAAFSALEVATEGVDPATAGAEQTEMLGKLKVMNHFIEYMLGGRVHTSMSKAKMDAAIEQSGIKNWTIKEIKNPNKTIYEVTVQEGLPPVRFEDANQLVTAMVERAAGNYKGAVTTKGNAATRVQEDVKTETKESETNNSKQGVTEQGTVKSAETKPESSFKELTDAEFETLKAELESKIQESQALSNVELNKNNIQVLDKVLSDEKLYNNENVMNKIGDIISDTYTPEQAKIADKILSDEKLYNNENVLNNIRYIIYYTNTPEGVQARIDIIDKFLSDEKLYNNKNVMNNIGDIISDTYTPEQAKIADKILSDEKLYNNENVLNNIRYIIYYTNTPEGVQARIDIIDKFLSDEKLYNNKNV